MTFDLISWIIGYGLEQISNSLVGKMFTSNISKKLNDVIYKWENNLPQDFRTQNNALFFYSEEKINRKSFLKIRTSLNSYTIPEKIDWFNLLIEQWKTVKKKNIKDCQPLFEKSQQEVAPYMENLAFLLNQEIMEDNKYYKDEVFRRFDKLDNKFDSATESFQDYSIDSLIEPSNLIKFSKDLVRTINIDPKTNRLHRQFRFRIMLMENQQPIYNLKIHMYLVTSRLVSQVDRTLGISSSWLKLDIKEGSNFIPKLSNYWTINYNIDPVIGQKESPFFKFNKSDNVIGANIRIFINGETSEGKRFHSEWEYDWSESNTTFGKFRLRGAENLKMNNDLFNDIITFENDIYDWPLFDIVKIGD